MEHHRLEPPSPPGHIRYYRDLIQGSDEWHAARCGLLTASEMRLIVTPTLRIADNDKTRAHVYELLAQRISRYVEPTYVSDDMLRGREDEIEARGLYARYYADVDDVGFITNDRWGFTIGYSPDGAVGDDGLIECKSRRQKYQIQTLSEDRVPDEYILQLQTGLLVSEREWIDFVSISGGLPLFVKRVFPDAEIQAAIVSAASAFEERLAECWRDYDATLAAFADSNKLIPTERRVELEMFA